jgi:hypothetical protein
LVLQISSFAEVGIHPSYRSSEKKHFPSDEVRHLSGLTGKKIRQSRQHFLKMEFPATYQQLIEAGITDDYSLGYADDAGFRAGMARPFPFFDLKGNTATKLTLHPFCFMEASYQYYLNMGPDETKARLEAMIKNVRDVGGIFYPIWHNESLSDQGRWKNWRAIHNWMYEAAKPT